MFQTGQIISFPKITDSRGNLSVIENNIHIPFEIKRIYYLYEIPEGEMRGAHAHKNLHQVIIAMSGSFELYLDTGSEKKKLTLNRPSKGVYIGPGTWREMNEFSSGAVCLVLASEEYQEEDYIRDYNQFLEFRSRMRD